MWFAVVVAAFAVLGDIGTAVAMKGNVVTRILMTLPNLFVAALAVLTALSLYIICERGLRPEEASNKGGRSAEGYASRH